MLSERENGIEIGPTFNAPDKSPRQGGTGAAIYSPSS